MPPTTDPQFWEQRYKDNSTRWDLGMAAPTFVSLLASSAAPSPGKTAVIGCGQGHDAGLFAQHGFDVIGFDFAPSAIAFRTNSHQSSPRDLRQSRMAGLTHSVNFSVRGSGRLLMSVHQTGLALTNAVDMPKRFHPNFISL